MSSNVCSICRENTTYPCSVISEVKLGAPPIALNELLYQCIDAEHQKYDEDMDCMCSPCSTKLLEYYEATILVDRIRSEFQKRIRTKPTPTVENAIAVLDLEECVSDTQNLSDVDFNFDDDWSKSSCEEDDETDKYFCKRPAAFKSKPNGVEDDKESMENIPLSAVRKKLLELKSNRYCNECDVECPSEAVLQLHKKKFHTKVELQPSESSSKKRLLKGTTVSKPTFVCDICGCAFHTQVLLETHGITHQPHHCSICGKTLANRRGLTRHMETHSQEKKNLCALCGNRYVTRSSLKKHMLTHKHDYDIRNFECTICGNRFRNAAYLKRHQTNHKSQSSSNSIDQSSIVSVESISNHLSVSGPQNL